MILAGFRKVIAHLAFQGGFGDLLHGTGEALELNNVPHGECVECRATTYSWCQEVNNWLHKLRHSLDRTSSTP